MVLTILLVLVAGACGPRHKNQCAGNTTGTCITGDVCTMDHRNGCMVCQCRPLEEHPIGAPDRPDPDDTAAPPVPVH
jgi:hypothetical protein